MNIEETLDTYDRAWNEDDRQTCRAHLTRCFSDRGVYCDPMVEVIGSDALAEHIEQTRRAFGGFRIKRTSGFEQHHDYGRFAWRMWSDEGEVIIEGFDVVRLAADGRFQSIVGFFGPFPEP